MDAHTMTIVLACLALIAQGAIIGFVYMVGFHNGWLHFERTHSSHAPASNNRPPQTPQMPKGQ